MSPGDPPTPTIQQQLEQLVGTQLPLPTPDLPNLHHSLGKQETIRTGRANGAETQPRLSLPFCQLALLGPALIHAHQLHPFRGTLGFPLSDLSTSKPSWMVFSAGTLRRQRRQAFSSELEAVKRAAAWGRTRHHGEVRRRG